MLLMEQRPLYKTPLLLHARLPGMQGPSHEIRMPGSGQEIEEVTDRPEHSFQTNNNIIVLVSLFCHLHNHKCLCNYS